MSTAEKRWYSAKEYLAMERASEIKHQYYQGEIFAMTGASFSHNTIVSNLLRNLGNHFEDGPCRALASDQRVKVEATGLYTYPDLTVLCGEPQFEDKVFDTLLNPKVIVEVLSDSTEAYDRGRKFSHYRTIDSLEEYVLVSQSDYHVEVFSKQANGQWLLSEARGRESDIFLRAIDCLLKLDKVYEKVEIPAPNQDRPHE
jgi:Uma2 family endonuclease